MIPQKWISIAQCIKRLPHYNHWIMQWSAQALHICAFKKDRTMPEGIVHFIYPIMQLNLFSFLAKMAEHMLLQCGYTVLFYDTIL